MSLLRPVGIGVCASGAVLSLLTAANQPAIRSFSASPAAIEMGTVAQLTWSATGAGRLTLDHGIGDVTGHSFYYVTAVANTIYTLTATSGAVSVRRQATLLVKPLAATPPGRGATYYVSPTGNDAADGISPQTAWRTVGQVNSHNFKPGDRILFQRGGEWRESLKAPSDGAAGNPITFADYGAGAKPKFWGSIELNARMFRAVGNGLYRYSLPGPVKAVLADHSFLYWRRTESASPDPGFWSFDGKTLTIASPASDPRSDGKVYTAVVREDLVDSNLRSHLVFRNLVADESAAPDGGYAFRIMGSQDVVLEGCEAYRAGKHHFGVIDSTDVIGKNLYAAWAMPGLGHGGSSAYVAYGDNDKSHLHNQKSEWHNCVWDHPEDPQDHDNYYAFYTHGAGIGSILIDNLSSLGGNLGVGNGDNPAASILIRGGLVQNARLEVYGQGVVVDGMRLTGRNATIDLVGSHLTLQNMIVDGVNLGTQWYQSALVSRGSDNTLRFSTIAVDPDAPPYTTCIAIDHTDATGRGAALSYYGNILIAPLRVVKQWRDRPVADDISRADYNFYEPYATFNPRDITLSQWRKQGLDAHSKQGDPRFADPDHGNYALASGSKAIGAVPVAALPNSSVDIGLDFFRSPRRRGANVDMGAIEAPEAGVDREAFATIGIALLACGIVAGVFRFAAVRRRRKGLVLES